LEIRVVVYISKLGQEDWERQTSLGYIASWRPVWNALQNPVSLLHKIFIDGLFTKFVGPSYRAHCEGILCCVTLCLVHTVSELLRKEPVLQFHLLVLRQKALPLPGACHLPIKAHLQNIDAPKLVPQFLNIVLKAKSRMVVWVYFCTIIS
jgi:hypothetical protein